VRTYYITRFYPSGYNNGLYCTTKKCRCLPALQVLSSDLETKQKLAPYLKHPVLRRVIQTFTNDEDGNMGKWACNPEVQRLLSEAKRLMDEGHVAEKEMERQFGLLISHLEVHLLSPDAKKPTTMSS